MDGQVEEGRCIIIETNYKMYAYTTSVLQEQVLRLFTEIDYKLPHMLIGVMTRKSIRRALTTGITATQIIDYLYMHAHPQVSRVVTCLVLLLLLDQQYGGAQQVAADLRQREGFSVSRVLYQLNSDEC